MTEATSPDAAPTSMDFERIVTALDRLNRSITAGVSKTHALRLWSRFIRERDGNRCVDCHSRERLSAHHICRKSLIGDAQYLTGNGITLCHSCHRELHLGFNGRPDVALPVDAEGGEKLHLMERLYSILTDDAVERGLMFEELYYLSDELLNSFKAMQGYGPSVVFPGSRIEQAYLILAECELELRRAIAAADGITISDEPLLPGGLFMIVADAAGAPLRRVLVRTYVPRSMSVTLPH